jgi:hypothetical protein
MTSHRNSPTHWSLRPRRLAALTLRTAVAVTVMGLWLTAFPPLVASVLGGGVWMPSRHWWLVLGGCAVLHVAGRFVERPT